MELLLEYKADTSIKAKDGRTAYGLAGRASFERRRDETRRLWKSALAHLTAFLLCFLTHSTRKFLKAGNKRPRPSASTWAKHYWQILPRARFDGCHERRERERKKGYFMLFAICFAGFVYCVWSYAVQNIKKSSINHDILVSQVCQEQRHLAEGEEEIKEC